MRACALCGSATEAGAVLCAHCLADQLAVAKARTHESQTEQVLVLSSGAGMLDRVRLGPRLLLLGGNVVAALVLAMLIGVLIRSAGQQPLSPGSGAPQIAAPVIPYPTLTITEGTPITTPHSTTPTVISGKKSTGNGPVTSPTQPPTPTTAPPTPTPVPPTPTPIPTVGQFQ